ncbi:protein NYNRIN-like [Belonocnema kinseyi]|uniref:protein NYNRIN-like n=1 Tax=Belonocnema kinseyi TaxID=2817044 RepID=UPI00143CCD9C|nr:protein NYNRIN-like [Belonocnema kinseyi]
MAFDTPFGIFRLNRKTEVQIAKLKPAGLLRTPAAQRRFETQDMDLVGPLSVTSEGYQWIYIVEEVTSKWVEIFASESTSANACAQILIDEVILRYGTPRRAISYNGTQFVGAVMQQVSFCLRFDHKLLALYHP